MFHGISPSKSGDFPVTESPWVDDGINVRANPLPSGYVNSSLLKMVIYSGFTH